MYIRYLDNKEVIDQSPKNIPIIKVAQQLRDLLHIFHTGDEWNFFTWFDNSLRIIVWGFIPPSYTDKNEKQQLRYHLNT